VDGSASTRAAAPRWRGFVLKLVLGLAIFAVVVYFVDLRQSLRALADLDPVLVLPGLAFLVATRFLMGFKWWVLLGGRQSEVSYAKVQRALLLSDYHGLLFPNTMAVDALRVVLLRHHPRGVTHMTATIVADRVINVVVTALVGLLAVGLVVRAPAFPEVAPGVLFSIVGVAVLVIAAGVAAQSRRLFALATTVLRVVFGHGFLRRPVDRVLEIGDGLHRAMKVLLGEPATLAKALAIALVVVAARIGYVHFLFLAIGIDIALLTVIAIYPVVTLVALLPLTLMGIGLKDGAFVFFFGGVGVPPSLALAVSLASYAAIIACSLVFGVLATFFGPRLPTAEQRTLDVQH
jgi:uncharacterized protein (TIRG00374 family)